MRFAVRALACLGAGAIALAVADPPATVPATTAAPAAASAPAATAAPTPGAQAGAAPSATASSAATAPAVKAAVDPEEKRLIAMGYKPVMRNGEKVFCHLVEETGSRLGAKKECGTAKELEAARTMTREQVEQQQRIQANPSGK
jgi:hypothetical protein